MPPYPNLVSDSTLVQDTIDLLTGSGGRAAASEIVDAVFKLSHIDDELAGLLVADLIRNDRRFKIVENTVELLEDDSRLRLLNDLDFVVVPRSIEFGGSQAIMRLAEGYLGASDHRKDGQAVGF